MNELISQLTKNLNIDQAQAEGGAGAIFNLVKQNLGGDFSKISSALPGIEQLMKSAPAAADSGALGGLLSSAANMFGNNQVGGLVQLAGIFKTLGIDMDTALKFLPIVKQFAESQGGDICKQLIEKALSAK